MNYGEGPRRFARRLFHLALLICPLLILALSAARAAGEPDFRQANWKMTQEEVKAAETAVCLDEQQDGLMYLDKVADFDCSVIYLFFHDRLYAGIYNFLEEHEDNNQYIDDFDRLKELLTGKYGDPQIDRDNWSDDSLRDDDPAHWGADVVAGHLTLTTYWETERTLISLMLHGNDLGISLDLIYQSVELTPLVMEEQKAQADTEGL